MGSAGRRRGSKGRKKGETKGGKKDWKGIKGMVKARMGRGVKGPEGRGTVGGDRMGGGVRS